MHENKEWMDIPESNGKPRVVVIGGGFGGLRLAKAINTDHFQVVLLDKNNYHIFQPLLYQVATCGIEVSAVSFPFRKIFHNRKGVHFRMCEALRADPQNRILETSIGRIRYDRLVIATGVDTNYFDRPELKDRTMALKTSSEALYNRNQILSNLEKAQNTGNTDERRRLMTFVIVGGGATGVELAGALAEMRKFVLPRDYPDLDIRMMRIIIVNSGPKLLAGFNDKSSSEAADYLAKRHVEIRCGTRVQNYENGRLSLGTDSIECANVFWTAGVTTNTIAGFPEEVFGRGRRFLVDSFNRVCGFENIYAIGDCALMKTPEWPEGHPQVAQPAMQQGVNVARNLEAAYEKRPSVPFSYFNKGQMATIGRNHAVVEMKMLSFGGFFGWAVWLFIHLLYIIGVKNRILIFLDWMWSYFFYDAGLRVIIKPVQKYRSGGISDDKKRS
jgi:NADH dehydrogenase